MPVDLRNAVRATRPGGGRILPLSLLLSVTVVLGAGIVGTSHFTGARWLPRISGGHRVPPIVKQSGTFTAPARPAGGAAGGGVASWVIVVAAVIAGLIAAYLLWRWWRLRRMPALASLSGASLSGTRITPAEPQPEPEPEVLLTGIELALARLDEEREPGDAIVRAWMGLQETAEESGIVRGASETPTEFTSRILNAAFADDRSISTLLRLYLRTRFGDHPVSAEDVASVRGALQSLVESWGAVRSRPAGRR